jgi:UDP-2,3-diacylglucosamine pyrophosphatase LpxH
MNIITENNGTHPPTLEAEAARVEEVRVEEVEVAEDTTPEEQDMVAEANHKANTTVSQGHHHHNSRHNNPKRGSIQRRKLGSIRKCMDSVTIATVGTILSLSVHMKGNVR